MADSFTFNLGLMFHQGANNAICTIVCYSHSPIDRQQVQLVLSEHLNEGLACTQNMKDLIHYILNGIKQECGVEAVLVNADAACIISLH